jgi:hypothetical protein
MPDVVSQFGALGDKIPPEQYNFKHFRSTHLIADVRRTLTAEGIRPGQAAPEFELPRAGGGSLRLRDLRGKPVLLRFGSFT